MNSGVPRHIAIVMDGNGRWATRRYMPRIAGHWQGVEALRRTVRACSDRGIAALTVFAFSSENWRRPDDEVSGLMSLLADTLSREVPSLHQNGVRVVFAGERESLSERIRRGLEQAELLTSTNRALTLTVAFNYGGRWDLVNACRRLLESGVKPEDVTEASLASESALAHVGDPDLIIRTGGEQRLSNFLLWHAAYSELFFTDRLWPEFDDTDLDAAIEAFKVRDRRFGGVSEQASGRGVPVVDIRVPRAA
jgi:undecaprenyl diphosphate synthase